MLCYTFANHSFTIAVSTDLASSALMVSSAVTPVTLLCKWRLSLKGFLSSKMPKES